jgi:hypothetical protein
MYFTADGASHGGLRYASIQAFTGLRAVIDRSRRLRVRQINTLEACTGDLNPNYRESWREADIRELAALRAMTMRQYLDSYSKQNTIYFSDPHNTVGTIKVTGKQLIPRCEEEGLFIDDRAGEWVPPS